MLEKISAFNNKANVVILDFVNNYSGSLFVIFLMIVTLLSFTFFILYLRGLWIEELKQDNIILKKRVSFFKAESERDNDPDPDKSWISNGAGEVFIN